jgi:hypothetical protein
LTAESKQTVDQRPLPRQEPDKPLASGPFVSASFRHERNGFPGRVGKEDRIDSRILPEEFPCEGAGE